MPIQEISGSRDDDNALYIHDNQTNYPTVFIENKGSGSSLYVENKGPGNIAWFEGNKDSDSHGVVIENIGGDNNALNITNHQTNYPTVWIDNSGSGDSLYVGNTGTGSAILCENSTNKDTLYVEQKGSGAIARFIGNYTSSGVIIQNIGGSHNALSIVNNIDTNSPAVCIENQGSGSSLYARNTGSGCIAYFEGSKNSDGHGVVITEIEGNNNALVIKDIKTTAPFPAVGIENQGSGNTLYAKNTGSGWVAHFEGSKESDGHGLVITDIGGNHNALLIRDCSTNYPAVAIENSGSGNGLFVNSSGSGYSIHAKGNVYVEGKIQEASSIAFKENVKDLEYQDAIEALKALNPVQYNYKADEQKKDFLGFIAEEVPDLVASDDHKKLSSMDIVAVLTKVVQEQQNTIVSLMERLKKLEKKQ